MNKLVICAGRGRSGSTLLYNLIRLTLIKSLGRQCVYGNAHREYNKNNSAKYHVVKLHGYNKYLWENADYVFSSHRDEEDQKSSWRRHQKKQKGIVRSTKEAINFIEHDYNRYKKWAAHSKFIKTFEFEDLIKNRWKIIKELCEIFNLNLDNSMKSVIYEVDSLNPPKKGYDPETCLTSQHFTSMNLKRGK